MEKEVYVGLGGNIGDSCFMIQSALKEMTDSPHVAGLTCSSFYRTEPISDLPQNAYTNAVCRFYTRLSAHQTLDFLQSIEKKLGKREKPKNAPRLIDLDLLFFGNERHDTTELVVPHPAWRMRLFVLVPLAELTEKLMVPISPCSHECVDLPDLIARFPLEEREGVERMKDRYHDRN
jgi:2-amino-4-hydroxy-6-hydroxymethyldihydropteridine diphosphokinase